MHRRWFAFLSVTIAAAACGVSTGGNPSGNAIKITSVNPGTGLVTGGIAVSISGEGLAAGSPSVLFGTSPAQVTSATGSLIKAVLPGSLACGNVNVQVSNGNGTAFLANGFNYTGGTGNIHLTSISPASGKIAGGTTVTITGSGFTGGVGVLLGKLPLNNVTVVSDTQVTGVTATATSGGQVDLKLQNCTTSGTLPGAFVYTTGLNGGVIDFNRTDYLNPAQFATTSTPSTTPTPAYSDPFVAFIKPSSASLVNPLPPSGTCQFNQSAPAPAAVTLENAGTTLTFSSAAFSMILMAQTTNGQAEGYFYPYDASGNLTSAQYAAATDFLFGASYAIDTTGTGGALPPFSVTNAFTTSANYTVSAPAIATSTPTTIPVGSLLFTWSGTGSATWFTIELQGYNNAGTPTGDDLFCAVPDSDGTYTIAATDMAKFTATDTQLIVLTNRRQDSTFLLPSNGSIVTVLASHYELGYLFATAPE